MNPVETTRPRVLCVEDDPDFLEALRIILEDGGYEVIQAASAEEGLTRAAEVEPDVALLDLMLEEVDSGVSLAMRLRVQRPDLPIYLLTSVGEALLDTHDSARLGLTGVLQKPIRGDTLLKVLENARGPRTGG